MQYALRFLFTKNQFRMLHFAAFHISSHAIPWIVLQNRIGMETPKPRRSTIFIKCQQCEWPIHSVDQRLPFSLSLSLYPAGIASRAQRTQGTTTKNTPRPLRPAALWCSSNICSRLLFNANGELDSPLFAAANANCRRKKIAPLEFPFHRHELFRGFRVSPPAVSGLGHSECGPPPPPLRRKGVV